jgi:predicted dehydrogenase
MAAIKWGMIGCGDVTEVKNGPGLYKCDNSGLYGVFNRTQARAEDWVKRHGHGKVFSSTEELLAAPEIDVVYVATTPDTHREFALCCAEAGKHCYLEKPVTPKYEDAVEIQKAFAAKGKKIWVAHYRRALPKTVKLLELLERIAPLRSVQVTYADAQETVSGWRGKAEIAGGGLFFEGGVHLVDLLDYLFGPFLDWKTAAADHGKGFAGGDTTALLARGRDGIIITGIWQYGAYTAQDLCAVEGEKGRLSFPGMSTGGTALLETGAGREEIILPEVPHAGMPLEQSIVNELLGGPPCPSTLESALRALKICCDAAKAVL